MASWQGAKPRKYVSNILRKSEEFIVRWCVDEELATWEGSFPNGDLWIFEV